MGNKSVIFSLVMLVFISLISFSSSLETYPSKEVNKEFYFCQTCADASYITLSSIDSPSKTYSISANMTLNGTGTYCYNYTPTEIGRYDFRGVSDGCEKTFVVNVPITNTGTPDDKIYSFSFIIFASILGVILFVLSFKYDRYLAIFSSICFFGAGIMSIYFPFGPGQQFITQAMSIVLNGLGLVILGVYVIKDWLPEDTWK